MQPLLHNLPEKVENVLQPPELRSEDTSSGAFHAQERLLHLILMGERSTARVGS